MPRHHLLIAGLLVGAMFAASDADAVELTRAADGATVAPAAIDPALAADSVVARLEADERLALADLELTAETRGRALIALSSEFLTVAVTSGRFRFGSGPAARGGQALLVALDGDRIQRLAFDGERLAATLSPGARPQLAAELDTVAAAQRRAAFWGTYRRLRVNARAPGPVAAEELRTAYLSEPAIVGQRRAAIGSTALGERARHAGQAFLAAVDAGDAAGIAALLDPAPFLSNGGVPAVEQGRRRAAESLFADRALQSLAGASIERVAEDGSAAFLTNGATRWRLALVQRDRALFVAALEPAP